MTNADINPEHDAEHQCPLYLDTNLMKIYCPKCRWEPPPEARWGCTCGHAWNTFDTQGQCPRCGKVWRDTQCLACQAWSPHHDWYHDLPPVDELLESEPEQWNLQA